MSLRKWFQGKARLRSFATRLQAIPLDECDGRRTRCRARASLRIVRMKHGRAPFRDWRGDDFNVTIMLSFSSAFAVLEKKVPGA